MSRRLRSTTWARPPRFAPRTKGNPQAGFTLVELLVVIVILGVLGGVVVLAVRGNQETGRQAAVATDERILRTALEAYCAQKGQYPDEPAMETLVTAQFLASPSEYHALRTGNNFTQGSCPGDGPRTYDLAGVLPPLAPQWYTKPPADLPLPYAHGIMVELPDGRLLRMNRAVVPHSSEFYDVAGKGWVPSVPAPAGVDPVQLVAIPGSPGLGCPNCGKVLVHSGNAAVEWALFDPLSQSWALLPPRGPQCNHGASLTVLADGSVLIAGCTTSFTTSADSTHAGIFDPKDPLSPWKPRTSMAKSHGWGLSVRLDDGRVLVVGGGDSFPGDGEDADGWRRAELYDPVGNSWAPAGEAPDDKFGDGGSATLIGRRALFIGREGGVAAVYDPDDPVRWKAVGSCGCGEYHTATRLEDGRVLVVGGERSTVAGVRRSAFLFDPATDTWTGAQPLPENLGRSRHAAGLLRGPACAPDCGKVVVAGGSPSAVQASTLLFSLEGKAPGKA